MQNIRQLQAFMIEVANLIKQVREFDDAFAAIPDVGQVPLPAYQMHNWQQ